MSWSFQAIGSPEKICEALDQESTKLSGQSKIEFDSAKPNLQALLKENFNANSPTPPVINFSASGSGSVSGETQTARSCTVSITPMYGRLMV